MATGTRESKTIFTAEDKTGGAFASFQKNIGAAQSKVAGLHAGLVGLAGSPVIGGFALMIKSALDAADEMGKLAQKAGVTTEEMSKLSYVAQLSGVEAATLTKGIKKLSESMVQATDATSQQAKVLKALGVDIRGGVSDALTQIADTFKILPDGATKTALAVEVFGKAGQDLIPTLNQGSAGIEKLKIEAERLGLVIGGETAKAAEQFNDNMRALQTSASAVGRSIVNEIAPALSKMSEEIKNAYIEGGKFNALIEAIGQAGRWAIYDEYATATQKLNRELKKLNEEFETLSKARAEPGGLIDTLFGSNAYLDTKINAVTARMGELRAQRAAMTEDEKKAQAVAKLWADYHTKEGKLLEEKTRQLLGNKDASATATREAEKLRQADVKGWVAYAEAVFDEADKLNLELAKISEAHWKAEDKLRDADLKGWVAYADAVFDEADENNRAIAKINEEFWKEQDRIRDDAFRRQVDVWDSIGSAAGNFFGDLVVNGRSAFDSLKQSLKSFAAEIIAFFAKRYVLQMIAGASGTFGATAANAASSALGGMGNSLLGTGLSAAGSYLFGTAGAASAPGAMAWAGGAWGAADAAATSGVLGSGGVMSSLGAFAASPVGIAVIAGLAIAAVAKIFDKGDATRTGSFGNPGSQDPGATRWNSALGTSAFFNTRWFGDDQKAGISQFMGGLTGLENAVGARLDPATLAKVKGSIVNRDYSFGTEHTGDDAQTFGQILKDRVHDIFGAIHPELQRLTDAFTGTGEELGNFALNLIDIKNAVDNGIVPGLTLDGLLAAQQAGEGLGDTLGRLKQVFDDAAAATAAAAAAQLQMITDLNAAIGARNPTFARGTTLTARNSIASQFGALVGQSFGDALLEQMALRPETFTGLSTEAGNLLIQFLGLQTTLEGLDAQLAGTSTEIVSSFSNIVNGADYAAAAFIDSANALMGAKSNLAGYLRGSLLSNLSPLTPGQQYAESRTQFNRMLGLAQGGDLDAINGLGSARDAFLTQSRAVNASSGAYNTDFFGSFNQVNAVSGFQVSRPFTNVDAAAQTAQLVAELQANARNTTQTNVLIAALITLLNSGLQVSDPEVQSILGQIASSTSSGSGAITSKGTISPDGLYVYQGGLLGWARR